MRKFAIPHKWGWWVGALLVSGCTTLVPPHAKTSKAVVYQMVQSLPNSTEKTVSLALMNHPDVKYRIDHNGYPTWRWRGKDDIGGCVHVDPKTLKPYLENQFAKSERTDVPKYIDFGTDGKDWQCRIHKFTIGGEIEKNWSTPQCHRDGKRLLSRLEQELLRQP